MNREKILNRYKLFVRDAIDRGEGKLVTDMLLFQASAELRRYSPEYEALEDYTAKLRRAANL